jgi:hypothetical protein
LLPPVYVNLTVYRKVTIPEWLVKGRRIHEVSSRRVWKKGQSKSFKGALPIAGQRRLFLSLREGLNLSREACF